MQVKVFESIDMASGLKMVKKELGSDALIISTKTIRNGKLGLLGKPTLEITAATDTAMPMAQSYNTTFPATFRPAEKKQAPGFNRIVDQSVEHFLEPDKRHLKERQCDFSLHPSSANKTADNSLAAEVSELKNLVKNLTGEIIQLHGNGKNPDSSTPVAQIKNGSTSPQQTIENTRDEEILSMLKDRGINDSVSRQITSLLSENTADLEPNNPELMTAAIIKTIQDLLHISPPRFGSDDTQHRIAFVGPTGVGKTTTLAKVAASYMAAHSPSIALITIDTYRIAAVEQLKVYGQIMHLPVDVVITPEQLKSAIEKHQDKDLILIDTAGRSPRDGLSIAELSTFLRPDLNIDKHLVLSAPTREVELMNTIERFKTLGISNTIFTKIDECSNLGVLLNVQLENSIPLSYVTNGQRVPEDLIEVSQNRVAELIMSQNEGLLHV
jgi:flagellar biosynthesis protein FlhF